MSATTSDLLRRAAAIQRAGHKVVGCLLVDARGSTPQSAGALMLVDDAATAWGTIGGGCVEAEVRQRAFALLGEGRSGILRFTLDHDYGWDDGLICGGTVKVAVAPLPAPEALDEIVATIARRAPTALALTAETDDGPCGQYVLDLPPRDRLYIAGAGHIGQALARLALSLDFDVTVFDDRRDILERLPDCVGTQAGDITTDLAAAPIDDRTYCVVVTRGHRHDARALHAVVGRGARYLGMIGSRRKVKLVADELIERGASPDEIARVHAPIGLDIGAVLVEEIAISIAGQLVAVRRASPQASVSGPHLHAAEEETRT